MGSRLISVKIFALFSLKYLHSSKKVVYLYSGNSNEAVNLKCKSNAKTKIYYSLSLL